jgi:alpha-glucosidase
MFRVVRSLLLLAGLSLVLAASGCSLYAALPQAAAAQATTIRHANDPWWKHAVIYEIYPRSFQDTNGDGVGDLNGITSRLDYLKDLGIDAIWLTPFYPSPQVDFGYDISDYTAVDPQFGTMEDFEHLVSEAKKRNIRVIVDYVANHTSDQHPWFKESRSSRDNPKRDWYIWRDGKAPGKPPNNWESWFGHSAWTFDSKTRQYYYHYFYVQQPDLNWRNPDVQETMYDVMRFWLDRGAAGFRIDAVSRLFEDPNLHDDPLLPGHNAYGDRNIEHKYTDNLPEVHDILKQFRKVVDSFPGDPVLISEADQPNIAELTKMYGNDDEIQLPMDFQIADVNKLSASEFRRLLNEVNNNSAGGQPHYFFSNHDQLREWDRYGDGVHNDQIAKLMAALLLTTRATPQMYYGEELGMRTTPPARKEDVKDPIGKIGWPKEKGRDGERTPMQWDASKNDGFSSADKPWLPVPSSGNQYNVQVELQNPDSILNFYKKLIQLRRTLPALRDGDQHMLDFDNDNVLAYVRHDDKTGSTALVVLNMTPTDKHLQFDLSQFGAEKNEATVVAPGPEHSVPLNNVSLEPFGVLVAEVH